MNPPPLPRLSGYAFADTPLDRADKLRDDAAALSALWPQARILVVDDEGRAHADEAGQPFVVTGAQLGGGPGTAIFLGLRDGQAWFAVRADVVSLEAQQRMDLRCAAATWPAFEAGVFALARALQYWQNGSRHCGSCGGAIAFRRAGYQGVCSQCGREHYPRVDPAVIVAVSDGERLLLGRQATWPPRRWSVVAGFVEPGESLEQTVAREVHEETCVRVRDCRYLGAQPWPFPGALMLGFEADADPDEPQVDDELEAARWFSAEEIGAALRREAEGDDGEGILLSPPISIARSLIERWYRQRLARAAAEA